MKKIALFSWILVVMLVKISKSQDSTLMSSKIVSFQKKVQREIEKNADMYSDILYPSNDYLERFLFFALDSTGQRIGEFHFVDVNGRIDSLLRLQNIDKLGVNWKDFLVDRDNYKKYCFVQPVSIRKESKSEVVIKSIPSMLVTPKGLTPRYVIVFPHISLWIGKSYH